MRFRKLRIAWSVASGVVAVLLIVLWVRSLRKFDVLNVWPPNSIVSMRGRLLVGEKFTVDEARVSVDSILESQLAGHPIEIWTVSDGVLIRSGTGTAVPIGLLVLLPAMLTAVPWLRCRQFSLRTLLIATTLLAVVLGLVLWATS
jgi:hypothetical protein